jgi:L-2,4-diaminobutyrate decarboxylase
MNSSRNKMEPEIPQPFSPESFRSEGHKLVDQLSDYLTGIYNRIDIPVLPWCDPDTLAEKFSVNSGGFDDEPFTDFTKKVIENSHHIHHPHYIGHQVTSPLPFTALIQLCTSLLNNGAAIYEMGPVAMAMERNLIRYFGELIGYTGNYDGIFTHGGSAGNLTGMLAIRQVMCNYNIWEDGVKENERIGFILSDQSHYGIVRNIKIMGLGDSAAVRAPYDNRFRMKTDQLESCLETAFEKGIRVVAVVANACSTATGSYDNLEEIGKFCDRHKLWMHVDGAHGLGVLFTDKYRDLVKGIERADSIVIDFHKMLLVGGLNTMVLFRDSENSFQTFSQKASYLFKKAGDNEWFNSAKRTLECTKSALGVVAYTAVKYYGKSYYGEYIESRYKLATDFAILIRKTIDFEIITQPQANIVCFRYIPSNLDDKHLNRLNGAVRDYIIKEGSFFIVQAEIEGKLWLRITILNPLTSINDLEELLEKIRSTARIVQQESTLP